jgi:ribosome-binding protein aMBF1 (putative translation factor)
MRKGRGMTDRRKGERRDFETRQSMRHRYIQHIRIQQERNLTQEETARELGVGVDVIKRLERESLND